MADERERRGLRGTGQVDGISRRTVAKGAAWAAPAVVVGVAAPAFAASTSCLRAVWKEAVYSGANGKWSFCLDFYNCGQAKITVDTIAVFTTYQPPANNTAENQLVHTLTPNTNVPASATYDPVSYCSSKEVFDTPPRTAESTNISRCYYNDFVDDDCEIDCVADDKDDPPVFPDEEVYPDSCKQLKGDGTFLVISYTMSGVTQTLHLTMDDFVGCRVTAGCQ